MWLPEKVEYRLTFLEAGFLASVLNEARDKGIGSSELMKPDADGKPVSVRGVDLLIEKLIRDTQRAVEAER